MTEGNLEGHLQVIGEVIAEAIDGDPDGAFLYAEVEPGVVYAALFLDRGGSIEWIDPGVPLSEVLLDAWHASDEGKAWATLSYAIEGNRYDASFQYPDEISEEEGPEDRRRRILKARYGDKPIKYPPPPSDTMEI